MDWPGKAFSVVDISGHIEECLRTVMANHIGTLYIDGPNRLKGNRLVSQPAVEVQKKLRCALVKIVGRNFIQTPIPA